MSDEDWTATFNEAKSLAGNTFHIVEFFIWFLADKRIPISKNLRGSIDALLEALDIDRKTSTWKDLALLNYGDYWRKQYGYK